jgi:hypothetical protein
MSTVIANALWCFSQNQQRSAYHSLRQKVSGVQPGVCEPQALRDYILLNKRKHLTRYVKLKIYKCNLVINTEYAAPDLMLANWDPDVTTFNLGGLHLCLSFALSSPLRFSSPSGSIPRILDKSSPKWGAVMPETSSIFSLTCQNKMCNAWII